MHDDPLLKVAMELERIALQDEYFIEKKLYPNIDFYSGITLKALGFPTSMFTALFALARTVGWIAQWKEMLEDPHQKIGRPRQIYTGKAAARLRADGQAVAIAVRRTKSRIARAARKRRRFFALPEQRCCTRPDRRVCASAALLVGQQASRTASRQRFRRCARSAGIPAPPRAPAGC